MKDVLKSSVLLNFLIVFELALMDLKDLSYSFFIRGLGRVELMEEFDGVINKLLVKWFVFWWGVELSCLEVAADPMGSLEDVALVEALPWASASKSFLAPSFLNSWYTRRRHCSV